MLLLSVTFRARFCCIARESTHSLKTDWLAVHSLALKLCCFVALLLCRFVALLPQCRSAPLHEVAKRGSVEMIGGLLADRGVDVNSADKVIVVNSEGMGVAGYREEVSLCAQMQKYISVIHR